MNDAQREWKRHRHRMRYERRLSYYRLALLGLLILGCGLLLAAVLVANQQGVVSRP